jgi:hypothetical protein
MLCRHKESNSPALCRRRDHSYPPPRKATSKFRPMDSAAAARSKTGAQKALTYLSLGLIMVVGPANFLLFRILYDTYGSQYAFFVSQGVNFIYCIVGGVALYPRMWRLSIVDRRAAAAATAADAAAAAAADADTPPPPPPPPLPPRAPRSSTAAAAPTHSRWSRTTTKSPRLCARCRSGSSCTWPLWTAQALS